MGDQLQHPLPQRTVHLCVDMQRLFSSDGPWPTPWMERVLPTVTRIAERYRDRTVFTRFITPEKPEDMRGTWRRYYEKWRQTTRRHLDLRLLELMPSLARLTPPAAVFDKMGYSAFANASLDAYLAHRDTEALIITGSETDVCVLATVLDAVDRGYRTLVVTDGICSSSDEGHDAMLRLYRTRFSEQIEAIDAETVLSI